MDSINLTADDFRQYMLETEPKQKVKSASVFTQDLIDDIGRLDATPKAYLPWEKTHNEFQFRPGEVTAWVGVNGQGKSLMTGMTALSLCTQEKRIAIASFEMKPAKSIERMLRQWCGQRPLTYEEAQIEEIKKGAVDLYEQFRDWTDGRMWFYDQQGMVKTEMLVAVIKYCADKLKIQHFFIDSLMKCIAGEDDYNGQKRFIDEMTAIARDTGMHIHVVHHMKKLQDEGKMPDKMDVKGSGSITDQVDNLLIVWRNKTKEKDRQAGKKVAEDEPDALLVCEKQRNGEWEGRINLWFDRESQQFVGAPGGKPLNMFNFPHRYGF